MTGRGTGQVGGHGWLRDGFTALARGPAAASVLRSGRLLNLAHALFRIRSGSLANLEGGNCYMKGLLLKGIAAFGVIAALGASSAQAQKESGNLITIGAFGGVAIPLSDYSDVTKTGWDLGAAFQFKPATSPVGFQLDGAYQQNKFDESVTFVSGKTEWWDATGNIVFWLPVAAETRIRPYILGGGGVYNYKVKPTGGSSTSKTKFGINGGAGFDFDVSQNAGAFIEGRFHNVFFSDTDVISGGKDLKFIPINVGVRYHFK
jgi:opacity protein-like surface antigen